MSESESANKKNILKMPQPPPQVVNFGNQDVIVSRQRNLNNDMDPKQPQSINIYRRESAKGTVETREYTVTTVVKQEPQIDKANEHGKESMTNEINEHLMNGQEVQKSKETTDDREI